MAAMPNSLVVNGRKQAGESANFAAFRKACPDFAGRNIVSVDWGGDPPDVLCRDAAGLSIGIELVRWLNEEQMARAKAQEKLEDSYTNVVRSWEMQAPANFGMTYISLKGATLLPAQDATQFRQEVYELVAAIDSDWENNPDKDDPQGTFFTSLGNYTCLAKYIGGLHITRKRKRPLPLGFSWLGFRPRGGAYTPDWMRDALLGNIRKKIAKYLQPAAQQKLQLQALAEFYLVVYYDEAVLYNTPYEAPGFGFPQIAAIVSSELRTNPHPFDKVFLSVPHEQNPVIQVWP